LEQAAARGVRHEAGGLEQRRLRVIEVRQRAAVQHDAADVRDEGDGAVRARHAHKAQHGEVHGGARGAGQAERLELQESLVRQRAGHGHAQRRRSRLHGAPPVARQHDGVAHVRLLGVVDGAKHHSEGGGKLGKPDHEEDAEQLAVKKVCDSVTDSAS
jgi:hypothetical protein